MSMDEWFWTRFQKDTDDLELLMPGPWTSSMPPCELDQRLVSRISQWSEQLIACAMRLQATAQYWFIWQEREQELRRYRKLRRSKHRFASTDAAAEEKYAWASETYQLVKAVHRVLTSDGSNLPDAGALVKGGGKIYQ